MERIIVKIFKRFLFSVCMLSMFLMPQQTFATDNLSISTLVTPQNVDFNMCSRTYILPAEKLFYLTIASVNANRFTVEEIQSKTGYILFSAVNKQYLASVAKVDATHSMVKITPTNNNYFFPPGVVLNFFKYIDLYGATPLVELPKEI